MRTFFFYVGLSLAGAAFFFYARAVNNDYLFFAGYTVLQFVVLATAWNILGGYCGYVNFGSAAFFAAGAYASVALYKLGVSKVDQYFPQEFAGFVQLMLLPALTIIGGIVSGLLQTVGVPVAAFVGGIGTAALLYVLAWRGGVDGGRLVLIGIAVRLGWSHAGRPADDPLRRLPWSTPATPPAARSPRTRTPSAARSCAST